LRSRQPAGIASSPRRAESALAWFAYRERAGGGARRMCETLVVV
jgi:hypothetical protein